MHLPPFLPFLLALTNDLLSVNHVLLVYYIVRQYCLLLDFREGEGGYVFKRETEHLSILQMKDLLMLTAAWHLERPTSHVIEQGIFSQDFLEIGVEHCR